MSLTPEQLDLRQKGIGGSDAPVVLGLTSWKSPLQLYHEKRGEAPLDEAENEAMLWGTLLEDKIAEEWARRRGKTIRRQPTRFSAKHPWMLVNMDRQIVNDPRGPGLLEVKNFGDYPGRQLRTLEDVPDYVFVQLQHGMEVTGYAWGAIAILVGGNRLIDWEITRSEELIAELVEREREFMARVREGRPPDADGSDATTEFLKRMYPKDAGKTITIDDPNVMALAQDLVDWKRKAKEAGEEWDLRKNAIKLLMRDASVLTIPGFGEFTWKCSRTSKQTVFDEERFRSEHPDLYGQYLKTVTTGGSRTFTDKPAKAHAEAA